MAEQENSTHLFNYQLSGAKWLTTKTFALLADEMGLGKTAQAIHAADLIDARPILVLCPAVARLNWMREFVKFSSRTLTFSVLLTAAHAKEKRTSDVTICSYDLASRAEVTRQLSQRDWSICVLDEAHYLKSRSSQRTKSCLGSLAPRSRAVWALSGTPAPNNPSELWPLLRVFGATGMDYWSFVGRYCVARDTPFGTQIVGGRNLDELRRLIAPIILRRKKVDVMKDLPPLLFSDVVVEPGEVPRVYWEDAFSNYLINPKLWDRDIATQQNLVDTLAGTGFGADSMKILEGLEPKVKSLRRWVGMQKVAPVVAMVKEELESGAYDKIVIFAVHKAPIEMLRDGLKAFGAVILYGGTPPEKRELNIKKFQNDPKCRVFIGQTVAAGTAITLTAAHQVMFVEADWTPANNQQATMRCHRIGQTKPVTVRFVGMAGSIDERIQQVLRRKTKTLVELFD